MNNPNCQNSMQSDSVSYLDQWGSLNLFYSIADGAIDNLQSSPNAFKKDKLYYAMNMAPGFGNEQIIDATCNQLGLYFLQGVGTVFCIVILCIAIFFTCCLRCCKKCSRKSAPSHYSKVEHFISLTIQLAVYIVCFTFILTGTIIYGVSVNNFITAITVDNTDILNRQYFINNTARQGSDQLQCAYDDMIRSMSPLPQQTSMEPQKLVNIWRSNAGVGGNLNVDTPDMLSNLIPQAVSYGNIVKANLSTLMSNPSFINDPLAQNELQNMIDQITTANSRMNNIFAMLPDVRNETVIVLRKANYTESLLSTTIGNYDDALLWRLNQSDLAVLAVLNSISGAGEKSAELSSQLWTTIATKMANADMWGGLSPIKGTAIAAIALPASIMMLFCVICIFICAVKLMTMFMLTFKKKADVEKHGRHGANFIRGGFYFTIWVGIVPFMVSIALIWYAQLYAGTCYNMYADGLDKFYRSVHNADLTVTTYNGNFRTTSYNQFLFQAVNTRQTMFSLFSSQKPLIGSSDIPNFVDVASTKKAIDQYLAKSDLEGGFDGDLAFQFSQADQALNDSSTDFMSQALNNGFLPYCTSLNLSATFDVNQELVQYSFFYLDSVQSISDNEKDATTKAAASSQLQTQNIMAQETQHFYINYFGSYVNSASANLLNRLYSGTYDSFPVYVNYMKSGEMLCNYVRSPLDGVWAAAGMIGIFWIPASICLFFTSNYLYKNHKRRPTTVAPEHQQVTQPIVVTPVVTTSPVQSVMVQSPPPTTVATAPTVVMATPVVTSTTTPALYPVIGSENLAIIEEL